MNPLQFKAPTDEEEELQVQQYQAPPPVEAPETLLPASSSWMQQPQRSQPVQAQANQGAKLRAALAALRRMMGMQQRPGGMA